MSCPSSKRRARATPLLTTREDVNLRIGGRAAQRERGALDDSIKLPQVGSVNLLLAAGQLVHRRGHLVVVERLA